MVKSRSRFGGLPKCVSSPTRIEPCLVRAARGKWTCAVSSGLRSGDSGPATSTLHPRMFLCAYAQVHRLCDKYTSVCNAVDLLCDKYALFVEFPAHFRSSTSTLRQVGFILRQNQFICRRTHCCCDEYASLCDKSCSPAAGYSVFVTSTPSFAAKGACCRRLHEPLRREDSRSRK